MAEYIEREAAIKAVLRMRRPENSVAQNRMLSIIHMDMLKLPAADVAPVVHARWIPSESDFDDDDTLFDGEEYCDWQCSACREDICYEDPMPMKLLPTCCPNCGAIMDGGADNASD